MRPEATAQGLQEDTDQPSGVPDRDKGGEARGGPMKARTILLGLIAGLGMFMIGESALAQCCAPPPPPCCTPPTPPCCAVPPPPPPSTPPCCTPGHNVNIPGVNVFVAPTVVVSGALDPADVVRAAVDKARGRLKSEKIDLLQFHWWMFQHPGSMRIGDRRSSAGPLTGYFRPSSTSLIISPTRPTTKVATPRTRTTTLWISIHITHLSAAGCGKKVGNRLFRKAPTKTP